MYRELVGFRALGRHGPLGEVVAETASSRGGEAVLAIRGGVSDGLLYVVPVTWIRSVVREERTVVLDVDADDFLPTLRPDGTVELRVSPR